MNEKLIILLMAQQIKNEATLVTILDLLTPELVQKSGKNADEMRKIINDKILLQQAESTKALVELTRKLLPELGINFDDFLKH